MAREFTERERTDRLIDQMTGAGARQKERRELEAVPVVPVRTPLNGALLALAKNALSTPSEDTSVRPALVPSRSLAEDGCDFIAAVYWMIEYMGQLEINGKPLPPCPAGARDLVLIICALSGGNYHEHTSITDAEIASLSGLDRHTISSKRESLIAWMKEINHAVIDIKEREYDPVTKKYKATQYRPVIIQYAEKFINQARSQQHKNPRYALKDTVDKGTLATVRQLVEDMPEAPAVERRRGREAKPRESQQTLLYAKQARLQQEIENFFGDALLAEENPVPLWAAIKRDAAHRLARMLEKYPQYAD